MALFHGCLKSLITSCGCSKISSLFCVWCLLVLLLQSPLVQSTSLTSRFRFSFYVYVSIRYGKYFLCFSSIGEILLCFNPIREILLCFSPIWEILLCFSPKREILLCFNPIWEILLCFNPIWEILLCFNLIREILLCFNPIWEILSMFQSKYSNVDIVVKVLTMSNWWLSTITYVYNIIIYTVQLSWQYGYFLPWTPIFLIIPSDI